MAMSVQPTYFVPRSSYYNSSSRDYSVDDSISKVEYFSNAVLEDTYDQACKSRVRDAELMRNANSTIVSAEQVPTPRRSSVISRRVRASTAPPVSRPAARPVKPKVKLVPSVAKDGVYYRPIVSTAGLQASMPPVRISSERRPIRDVEGFTKPKKNLMSWEYRVDSRISPSDIIYEPASYSRLREQVRDVKGKMDVEKQLLDRYLGNDPSSLRNKAPEGSVNIPDYYACGGDPRNQPVSELRRRLRRMVCDGKTTKKYNPHYYKVCE